jgi:Ser/Thr protein kinase RdoA (MazF antagonist)
MWRRPEPLGPDQLQRLLTRWFGQARVQACLGAWENFVYRVGGDHDRAWVLRVTEGSRRRVDEIGAELAWLGAIAQRDHPDVAVPSVRPSRSGALVETVDTPAGPHHAVVFEHLEGTAVSREQCRTAPAERWRAWGRAVAVTHQAAPAERGGVARARRRWDEDPWLGSAETGAGSEPGLRHHVETLRAAVARAISPGDVGLVHGDVHARNVLLQPSGRLALLDFDDACSHWRAYDLAVALNDSFDDLQAPAARVARRHLVAGYRSVRPLDDRSVDHLDLLARWRQTLDLLHYRHAVSTLSGPDRREAQARVEQLRARLASTAGAGADPAER